MKYKHLFFDLDHTLWDFEKNSKECLLEIYDTFKLDELIHEFEFFYQEFSKINKQYWSWLESNVITHEELRRRRFRDTLTNLGVEADEALGLKINEHFLGILPNKAHLIEGAVEVLDYLLPHYQLHIISNGWQEVQVNKMKSSEIHHYFGEIITNEVAGSRKPNIEIFRYALRTTNAQLVESLMIGDNYEADILGAKTIEMDTVFYNPEKISIDAKPTFEIERLIELKDIL